MALDRAWELVVRTCWLEEPVADATEAELVGALGFARRNDVESMFVHAYPERLPAEVATVDDAVGAYRLNLRVASERLTAAGVRPILIKALPDEAFTYSNFDVVVGDDGWDAAVDALRPWAIGTEQYVLERGTKMLFYPPSGPAVHLHREVAWFDVPAIPTGELRAAASEDPGGTGCLLPSPPDALRILLAHAVFQNLALSLGDLRRFRELSADVDLGQAANRAGDEGWGIGFRSAVRTARRTMRSLDRLQQTRLPVPLPIASSVVGGVRHALFLAGTGRWPAAARELALRGPLVAAKRRAVYR